MPNLKSRKGDTIVEVLFAVSILGFVIMVMLQLMQQGSSAAQLALEITLVRNQMNTQAEALRMMNAAAQHRERAQEAGASSEKYFQMWNEVLRQGKGVDSWDDIDAWDEKVGRSVCHIPEKKFIINTRNMPNVGSIINDSKSFSHAAVFSRVVYGDAFTDGAMDNNKIDGYTRFYKSEGMWIQFDKVDGTDDESPAVAYDFHIRACWETPGKSQPIKLGTIIRLHQPQIKGVSQ